MNLKPLIKNQKIIIDNHHRGDGHQYNWDDKAQDIHIDKRTNTKYMGQPVEVTIRVPINSENPISCKIKKAENKQYGEKILKEVKRAFQNPNIRELFVQDLIKILRDYSSKETQQIVVLDSLRRIAKHFGLTDEMIDSMQAIVEEHFQEERINFKDENNNMFFVAINTNALQIGQYTKKEWNNNREIWFRKGF